MADSRSEEGKVKDKQIISGYPVITQKGIIEE